MLRWCITCLHAKGSQKHCHSSCINRGGTPPSQHTLILSIVSHTSLSSCSFYILSCLEQDKATLESLAPWKKWLLGMNRIMSSSKAMLSYYIYSHTYELEYDFCVMIMICELVQSLCVMRVAHLTLCLTNHITCITGIRVKLRWQFIELSGVPKFFTCRSVGSGTWGNLGSFCIRKRGTWVWRDKLLHCPFSR
jgi:hypothetical protein